MKKKKVIIVSLLLAILLLIGAAVFLIMKENGTDKQTNFTRTVSVTDGVANPKKDVLNLEIEHDGDYVYYLEWEAESPGLLTGINLVSEDGESVFNCTGETAYIETMPLKLKAGNYQMEIYYIASDESLEEFFEITGLEGFEDNEEYLFVPDGEWKTEYDISWEKAGAMSHALKVGIIIGAIIGLLVAIIVLASSKTDDSVKSQFDERQEAVRGRGFKYGFFTMILCDIIITMLKLLEVSLLQELEVAMVLSIMIGVMVFASYCIWNDGYFALNENRKQLMIFLVIIGVINLLLGVVNVVEKVAIIDGRLTFRSINLFCGLLFVVIFMVMFLKKIKDGKGEQE